MDLFGLASYSLHERGKCLIVLRIGNIATIRDFTVRDVVYTSYDVIIMYVAVQLLVVEK